MCRLQALVYVFTRRTGPLTRTCVLTHMCRTPRSSRSPKRHRDPQTYRADRGILACVTRSLPVVTFAWRVPQENLVYFLDGKSCVVTGEKSFEIEV